MSFTLEPRAGNQNLVQVIKSAKIGAGVNIEQGKFYVFVGGYLKVPAAANAATGYRPVKALDNVDNTSGADGALTVDGEYNSWYDLPNDGTHPVDQTYVGKPCYLSSAFTLSQTSADGPLFGTIIQYNQPNNLNGRPVRAELK